MSNTNIKIMLDYAKAFIGNWYIWGGDDPSGFDCSGFVIECLKAVGYLPRKGDWTADQLSRMFIKVNIPEPGCLAFWENSTGKIIHVEIMLTGRLSIGASGGGSKTKTLEDAINHNAFIKIRPINSRPGLWGYCNPFA